MNISLTPELEKLVRNKVKAGRYHSSSEVLREGLRLLDERDHYFDEKLKALKHEIAIGIDQADRGEVAPFDRAYYQSIIEEARRKKGTS